MPESGNGVISRNNFNSLAGYILDSPKAVAAMKAHGVSLTEAVAISMYTSQAYVEINREIRDNNESPAVTALREAFTSGLAKLPSFRVKEKYF